MKKKALIVTSVGGFLSQYELGNVDNLQNLGYEVHYATNFGFPVYPFDKNELEKCGIVLHPIKIKKKPKDFRKNISVILELKRIIEREDIQLIHCHNPMGGVVARTAAMLSKTKPFVIYTAHGFHFYEGGPKKYWLIIYPIEKFFARKTDTLITINSEDYSISKKMHMHKSGSRYYIYGAGVDMNRFRPMPEIYDEMRDKLDVPKDAFHIVSAGELNDNKNNWVIIEALHQLNDPDIYYTICGDGVNAFSLANLIKSYGLENQVRMVGYRNDMENVLNSADCFAFPSIREGLGLAAVEALSCGIPLIISDNRGSREFAVNEYNALICNHDDPAGFAKAIARMKEEESLRKRLAGNSRESVERFNKDGIKKVMENIYRISDKKIMTKNKNKHKDQ